MHFRFSKISLANRDLVRGRKISGAQLQIKTAPFFFPKIQNDSWSERQQQSALFDFEFDSVTWCSGQLHVKSSVPYTLEWTEFTVWV